MPGAGPNPQRLPVLHEAGAQNERKKPGFRRCTEPKDSGQQRLEELGYHQELKRCSCLTLDCLFARHGCFVLEEDPVTGDVLHWA